MRAHLTLTRTDYDGSGSGLDIASKPEVDRDVVVVQIRHDAPLETHWPQSTRNTNRRPELAETLSDRGALEAENQ